MTVKFTAFAKNKSDSSVPGLFSSPVSSSSSAGRFRDIDMGRKFSLIVREFAPKRYFRQQALKKL
jgi:hypothetical protein